MKTIKVSKVCSCGKGHRSRVDGRCGHCRSKKDISKLNTYHLDLYMRDKRCTPDSLLGKGLRLTYFGAIYEID
ncbi:TPA_asm: hypothetical protein G2851_23600 [Salmonella enterica subsp. enterica serovar Enteritidis]|nr:hypothetical protein [Salmonella enterica subsp. enterica serovar Enteritidis]